jgi:hypothetical protein
VEFSGNCVMIGWGWVYVLWVPTVKVVEGITRECLSVCLSVPFPHFLPLWFPLCNCRSAVYCLSIALHCLTCCRHLDILKARLVSTAWLSFTVTGPDFCLPPTFSNPPYSCLSVMIEAEKTTLHTSSSLSQNGFGWCKRRWLAGTSGKDFHLW